MKKGSKNLSTINCEIDYDKLTQVIINAEKMVEERKEEETPKIFINLLCVVLWGYVVFSVGISGAFIMSTCEELVKLTWKGNNIITNIFLILICIAVVFSAFLILYVVVKLYRDFYKYKKQKNIKDVVNTILCFTALIVSLIAVFK